MCSIAEQCRYECEEDDSDSKEVSLGDLTLDQFNFETIPTVLRDMIVEEIGEASTIQALSCCSKYTENLCDQRKALVPICVDDVEVNKSRVCIVPDDSARRPSMRLRQGEIMERPKRVILRRANERQFSVRSDSVTVKCTLTSKRCRRLIEEFRENGTNIERFMAYEKVICTGDEFNTLLEILKCESILCMDFIRKECLQGPYIQNIPRIDLHSSDISDDALLGLNAHSISTNANSVSNHGIAQFVKKSARLTKNGLVDFELKLNKERHPEILQLLGAELYAPPGKFYLDAHWLKRNASDCYYMPSNPGYFIDFRPCGQIDSRWYSNAHRILRLAILRK